MVILSRKDANRDWIFARCREVQAAPDGYLDLWSREHYKSTAITFGKTIQDILCDPELTVGIFSYSRPIAKAFLRQIMNEFEANQRLRALFPDILWEFPRKNAPKWSEDDGIVVKRLGNPKESSVEAWGLVDGQPTSKHYGLMVYDDVVTDTSVTTPEMIAKVTRAWETSRALSAEGGRTRYVGTRWHAADTYRHILQRGAAIERRHAVTLDGTAEGEPVLWTRQQVAEKRRELGPYAFSAQYLLDPAADRTQGFRADWRRFHDGSGDFGGMNKYILVDPANSKKKQSDYTAMVVIGLADDQNYYLLDGVRDRLSLGDRAKHLFALHRKWRPLGVGYEKYGMTADIEFVEMQMADMNYRFEITPVAGETSKVDRIRRMIPIFETKRFYLPEKLIKFDYEGRQVDLVEAFIDEEYDPFPVGLHDDFFDAISRIWDIQTEWPMSSAAGRLRGRIRSDYRPILDWDRAHGEPARQMASDYRPYRLH